MELPNNIYIGLICWYQCFGLPFPPSPSPMLCRAHIGKIVSTSALDVGEDWSTGYVLVYVSPYIVSRHNNEE